MKRKKIKKETSFLTSLILLFRKIKKFFGGLHIFSRISKKEKRLSYYDSVTPSEESKIAYVSGIIRVISALMLTLLLIITLLFGSGTVTYDKIYYMFKDITYIKSYAEGVPNELSYSKPVQNQVFRDYKNGLLVAGDSEIKLFTSTGRVTMIEGSEYTNPRVAVSDEYALIYDQGRNTYSIYNSFVKLYSERTPYRISSADMSDNGYFLIVTKSKTYNSLVKIYDNNFRLISEYSKNDYVISASLSSSGRYAAVISMSAHDGESVVTLTVLDTKTSKIVSEKSLKDSMPYSIHFLSDDRIVLFLDDRFCIFNKKGDIVHEYSYPSGVQNIDIREDGFVMLFEGVGENAQTLEMFNREGKRTFIEGIDGNIKDVKLGEGAVYVLTSKDVLRINTSLGTRSACRTVRDGQCLVVLRDGVLLVCSQTAANYISFD